MSVRTVDIMSMAEDTRIGIVLFAEESSDLLKLTCDEVAGNESNADVSVGYTFSQDLAEAFNKPFPSMIMLQVHNVSVGGIALTTSKGPRDIVNVGAEGVSLNKEFMLGIIEQMRPIAELSRLQVRRILCGHKHSPRQSL
jgi:hypothetical protein